MGILRGGAAALLGLGLIVAGADRADARITDIDSGPVRTIPTLCIGTATVCGTQTQLTGDTDPLRTPPLVADFGLSSGPFSSLYIYNNGLVSIGAPIAAGADLSSLSTIGGNVFTAGYSPTMTLSNFLIQGPNPATAGGPTGTVVRVYYNATFNGKTQQMEFNIFDQGSGNFLLSFNHGDNGSDPSEIDFPSNGYLGYSFDGVTVQSSNDVAQRLVRANTDFNYRFRASTAVPEPATWSMLLLGFGGVGAIIRRSRRPLIARAFAT